MVLNVLAGGYFCIIAIPNFLPKSTFLDFRTFRSAALRSYCEFLIPMQYRSKICIVSPEINVECYNQMYLFFLFIKSNTTNPTFYYTDLITIQYYRDDTMGSERQ